MDENTKGLLFQVAAYLTMISQGAPIDARTEADKLLIKVGRALAMASEKDTMTER